MWRRSAVFVGLMSIVGLLFMQSPASAGHGDISVPLTTFIQADEGEVVVLASVDVDAELVGEICNWEFHSTNQESAHPGNDLILSTFGSDTIVSGVEDAPDQVLDVAGSFQLGETLTVSLRMGPDGVFSAGLNVEVVCDGEVTPTTAATATTTPVDASIAPATATTAPVTATTAPVATSTAKAVVDAEVAGEVVVAESAAAAPAAAVLAVTGPTSSTFPLVAYAVFLLLGGIVLLRLGTSARH